MRKAHHALNGIHQAAMNTPVQGELSLQQTKKKPGN
jgi:hypothetical protein